MSKLVTSRSSYRKVRVDIAKKYGITWYKKAFFWLMRHRKIMDMCASMGWVFQSCGFKLDQEKKSMKPRFSIPGLIKKDRLLPTAKSKSFLNSYPELINNGGYKKVGIFIGCMANYAYTDIGKGLLNILRILRIDAHLMKSQACCGAPAYFTGDFDTVEYLAKKNIIYFEKILEDVEAIIIPEATCSAMIREDYIKFFENDLEWQNRAINLKNKIFMASDYLERYTNLKSILKEKGKSNLLITYHDPCHARKMQGVYKEPRALLSQNYILTEMSNPNQCCGFGGVTMQSQKFHFAEAAGKPKAYMIDATGASVVGAECSACKMQLGHALSKENSKVIVKNPIELISEALS